MGHEREKIAKPLDGWGNDLPASAITPLRNGGAVQWLAQKKCCQGPAQSAIRALESEARKVSGVDGAENTTGTGTLYNLLCTIGRNQVAMRKRCEH